MKLQKEEDYMIYYKDDDLEAKTRTENTRGMFQHHVQSVVGVYKLLEKTDLYTTDYKDTQNENMNHSRCPFLF